jgi:thiamine pyrophosphate-dependent acetolactate synthase large subunit-like protein
MKMTIAELIMKYLDAEGVEYLFEVLGATLEP